MQRSSCLRLRSSTGPNVLMFTALILLCGCRFGKTPGGLEPPSTRFAGARLTTRPRCRREPPRGVEPLPPGSKPGALPLSYEGEFRRAQVPPGSASGVSARGSSRGGWRRQKRPLLRQQFLKAPPGSARARVVVAEALEQLDLAAPDGAVTALDAGLGREAFAPLAHRLERTGRRWCACWRPSEVPPCCCVVPQRRRRSCWAAARLRSPAARSDESERAAGEVGDQLRRRGVEADDVEHPGIVGSAIEKPFETMPTTTSRASIPDAWR